MDWQLLWLGPSNPDHLRPMSETCIVANSFAGLPEASRHRLRAFLDATDSASPYQDPAFFSGRGCGEVDLLVEKDGRPIFFALGFENAAMTRFLPWLRSLVVHKGPVADDPDALMSGLQVLKEFGRKKRLCEIHINPQITEDRARAVEQVCSALGFRPLASPSPNRALRLDVACDFEEILARFRPKTRQLMKRAGRIGITVRRAETEADFLCFYQIYKQRALQKGFDYLAIADFMVLSERMRTAPERSALLLSEYKGDILAGEVFLRAGPRIHSVYAAISEDGAGNLPRRYPIIGRAIEWAKEIGCTEFDFGGYGPPGVRQFKEGFSGEIRTLVPTYSLTLIPMVPRLRRVARLFRS